VYCLPLIIFLGVLIIKSMIMSEEVNDVDSEEYKIGMLSVSPRRYAKIRFSIFFSWYDVSTVKIGNAKRYPAANPIRGKGLPATNSPKHTSDGTNIKDNKIMEEYPDNTNAISEKNESNIK
jgi:hypothetical protein